MGALTSNEYCKVGRAFLRAIDKLVMDTETKDKGSLFDTLDKIKLVEGSCLGLYLAHQSGMGDESWFYTFPVGKDPLESNVVQDHFMLPEDKPQFDGLRVEPSAMGAWQAYLYHIAPTVMPVWWHGGYICRDNIFSEGAFNKAVGSRVPGVKSPIKGLDKVTQEDVLPTVTFENGKAVVSCCYWSNWGGLIRETVVIKFKGDKVKSFSSGRSKTLVFYDCGICF